jgi:cellulose synthase/poly-beta-1,6-N-acetylglucosamine synthase-like glycosyltransferase
VALLLLIPTGVLLIECMAALLPTRRVTWNSLPSRPTIAVLVPAHNEASGIAATLETILPELSDRDRVIVIADNCEDETAEVARETGAMVIERQDAVQRGKGYALDFGIRFLAQDPPQVLVIVDADCDVLPGAIAKTADLATIYTRPVQATYLLTQSASPQPKDAVSALAFMVKNLVRPMGLDQLRQPCLLTGTGMAFPWSVIGQVSLASGNIVEDMKLALDLAIAGHPPMFCSEARVMGQLPQQSHAVKSQRTRWEHGHLQTLLTQVPRLLKAAIQQRRFDLFVMALDLSVPPLSLFVMLWFAATIVALSALWLGVSLIPTLILAIEGVLLLVSIMGAWIKFGRDCIPLHSLLSIPLYILWKIPLYFKFLIRPQTAWVRTDRDVPNSSESLKL